MGSRTPDLILYTSIEYGEGFKKQTIWGQIGVLYENPEGSGFTGELQLLPGQSSKIIAKPPEASS